MTKWIKIEVPDDFEPTENNFHTLMYGPGGGDIQSVSVNVWEPVYTDVLDHGFIGLVDFMGDDSAAVQAARVSYGKGTKSVSSDRGLIRYLLKHHHCYHPSMEVLTATGWKRWDQCQESETFLVPNPYSGSLEKETLKVVSFDYSGKMCSFNNERMSYCVTPNHKMLFKPKYQRDTNSYEAATMPLWGHFVPFGGHSPFSRLIKKIGRRGLDSHVVGLELNDLVLADHSSNKDIYNLNPFFQFLGFYLGDGSHASTNRLSFHLKKNRKIEYLKEILKQLNLEYTEADSPTHGSDGIVIHTHIPEGMDDYVDLPARSSEKKFFNNRLLTLNDDERLSLLIGLINSDGHIKEDRDQIEFSSTSSHLLDLFQTLSASIGIDSHKTRDDRVTMYDPYGRTSLESRKQYHSTSIHSGKVFCATTSTGWLVVRGGPDKFAFICGNSTPFEMIDFKFHVKAPIFVFRQWHRHRASSINEMSARYSLLDNEMYIPDQNHCATQSTDNKQGRLNTALSEDEYKATITAMEQSYYESYGAYSYLSGQSHTPPDSINNRRLFVEEQALNAIKEIQKKDPDLVITSEMIDAKIKEFMNANDLCVYDSDFPGVARELARSVLPVATYSQMYWKANLRNIFNFCSLRSHPHAQYEIRVYSDAMLDLIKPFVPMCVEAFIDYQLQATDISRMELEALRAWVHHADSKDFIDFMSSDLQARGASGREINDFLKRMAPDEDSEA